MRRIFLATLLLFFFTGLKSQDLTQYGWTFYDTLNKSLADNHVKDILMDKQGRVWVTTGNMSLNCMDSGRWKIIEARKPDSLVYGWLMNMALLSNGNMAITGIPGKLAFFSPATGQWTYVAMPQPDLQPLKIHVNDMDLLLVGTPKGLFSYDGQKWRPLITDKEDVMGISAQRNGDVIVTCRKGMFRLIRKKGRADYRYPFQISEGSYYEAVTDRKGRLWATSFSDLQLHQFRDTGVQVISDVPEAVFYNFNGTWKYIAHNVAHLPDERLVITTQFGAHLAVKNTSGWETYSVPLNGKFDGVGCIRFGPDSSIWLGTWHHGVVVFSHKNNLKHPKVERYPSQQQDPGQFRQVPPPGNGRPVPGPKIPMPRMRED